MSKLQGDNLMEFAKRLSSAQKVLEFFPSLAIPHVQVIVKILPESKSMLFPISCTSLIKTPCPFSPTTRTASHHHGPPATPHSPLYPVDVLYPPDYFRLTHFNCPHVSSFTQPLTYHLSPNPSSFHMFSFARCCRFFFLLAPFQPLLWPMCHCRRKV